jgi:hypothetical protein
LKGRFSPQKNLKEGPKDIFDSSRQNFKGLKGKFFFFARQNFFLEKTQIRLVLTPPSISRLCQLTPIPDNPTVKKYAYNALITENYVNYLLFGCIYMIVSKN